MVKTLLSPIRYAFLASLLFIGISVANAQNIGVNTSGTTPDASAGLDVDFTNKGLLIPRVALTATNSPSPISTPATSLLVYNTATVGGANAVSPGFYYWNGTEWVRFSTTAIIDTDDQTLSVNGDTLFIADGNYVILTDDVYDGDSSTSNEIQTVSISNDTLFLTKGGFAVIPSTVDTDDQTLSLSGDSLFIADGNYVILTDYVYDGDSSSSNEIQSLTKSNDTLFLSNGGFVVLTDTDPTNELQNLSISNDTVFLSNGGYVVLPAGTVDTDDQTLSLSGDTLFIADGNYVLLTDSTGTDDQQLSLSNDTLYLEDGGYVLLTDTDPNNEIQNLTISNDTVFLSNGGYVVMPAGTVDTDDQTLSLSGDTLFIADGNYVLLTDSTGTDDQQLSLSNDTLYLEDGGYVLLTDTDPNNEIQNLTISNDTVFLSNGGYVVLPAGTVDTDDQTLSLSGDTLFIADGNYVLLTDSTGTDDQQLSLSNDTLYLEDGGYVLLTDTDSTNELQNISISNDTLFLTNGGFAVLPSGVVDTDDQTLSLSGDTLFIADGNYVLLTDSTGTDDQQLSLSNDTLYLEDGGFVVLISSGITGVIAGAGLIGGGTSGTVTLHANANNGLTVDTTADMIQLGGPLIKNTTITHDAYSLTHNLSDIGDFIIQDSGVNVFEVRDNGETYFGDNTNWRSSSTSGTDLGIFSDNAGDGRFRLMENGLTSVDLDANTKFVFNEQGLDRDFRIESDLRTNMFLVDASLNNIGINNASPGNQVHFLSDGRTGWITLWSNTNSDGGLKQVYNTDNTNGSRVLMGVTNYSSSAYAASALMGLSMNTTNAGSGGIGVLGAANNESGNAVEGNLSYSGPYSGWAGYFNADVYGTAFTTPSDRRFKRDVKPITSALSLINRLNPVSYYYDTDKYPGIGFDENRLSYGFIAQELEQVIPEIVKEKNLVLNSNSIKSSDSDLEKRETGQFKVVNYTLMIPFLTQAIKEQQSTIDSLKEKVDAVNKKVSDFGVTKLTGSETFVSYGSEFKNSITGTPVVTVTPLNTTLTISIVRQTVDGFVVKVNGAFSPIEVNWIAMGNGK